ncbi:uncharacterized protein TM35_000191350 [Trypanosoma theileri]|uniref:Cyclic nucleotide-binding domain-containing protein n=1 Tax=Trypanosoma theileri TaxID=67003 RepID=A0A1X0NTG0_9TRYP|nr:uncharacterized protein TM35_000191350 [Trypanosoma theileri]ORC87891.1 hypothetical protein TM35_000191350 [Trypanosoma theileri]
MSILSILTPAERRFFDEAIQRSVANRALEEAKESVYPVLREQPSDHSRYPGQPHAHEQQHSVPRFDGICGNSTKPSEALARYAELSRQEYDLWDRVERSLELPFVYRSEANKNLCYKMLRRVPLLRTITEGDLEVISSHMEVLRLSGTEVLAGKPPFPDVQTRKSTQSWSTMTRSQFDDNDSVSALIAGEHSTVSASKAHREPGDSMSSSGVKITMGNRIFILLRGRVVLRIPSLQTAADAYVEPYEVFALPVMVEALPDGSWYETDGDCMLISLTCNVDLSLDRVIRRIENNEIEKRISFLQRQLRVKVFTHWTREQYEACARALVPIRVSWRQLVVDQGMESDAMYFIYEGQCIVLRDVPLQRQQSQQAEIQSRQMSHQQYSSSSTPKTLTSRARWRLPQKHNGSNSGKTTSHLGKQLPSTGVTSPLVKTMEIVTLREGEFFGELGLLNHQVDWKPDVDTIWSRDYWQKTLDSALRAPVDFSALDGTLSWCTKSQGKSNSNDPNGEDSHNNYDGVFPPVPLPRQATVYTKSPCLFYMLSNEHCRSLFGDREYAQLKEFAKGYPSCEDIEEQYERQRKWLHYRKTLVNAVMQDSSSAKRKIPKLPPLQFH